MNGTIEMLKSITLFPQFVTHVRLGIGPDKHDSQEPILPFGLNGINQDGCEVSEANSVLSLALNNSQLRAHDSQNQAFPIRTAK